MAKRLALLKQIRHELDELPVSQQAQIDDPVMLGHSMASMLSHHSGQYGQLMGPLYSDRERGHVPGIDSRELARRVSTVELLALPFSGQLYFPAFRFRVRDVRDDALSLVRILRITTDPITLTQ